MRYRADGSDRLPDTSAAVLDPIVAAVRALYPVPDVLLTLEDAVDFWLPLDRDGGGWLELVTMVSDMRARADVSPNTYFLALVTPAESHEAFCEGLEDCVLGASPIPPEPELASWRVSTATLWPGEDIAPVVVHELGHAHGRMHSPCGTDSIRDPQYPHPDGTIGVWGYDSRTNSLIAPSGGRPNQAPTDAAVARARPTKGGRRSRSRKSARVWSAACRSPAARCSSN